ncbi:PH domain-containing protein [Propioniferax innocua]|uniref:PH (Pleckstrin Homology) domain-containing protein n=1 Tax=Propioniferax innocua TaxID=1753 RepID=A0A542ZPX9_9ACTN|nr:PH domain-containing protein [Propioniferax innocua]TQL62289.1 PH (Pleckstrin Homology) domain-containing protein [Propioniferax innocua]
MAFYDEFLHPDVDRLLISDQGEIVVDEVRRHPVRIVVPVLGIVLAAFVFMAMPFVAGVAGAGYLVLFIIGILLVLWGVWRIHSEYMDRFVITNMRVFRVHGVFTQHVATMPLQRILDIAVERPFMGRLLGYGHFVFESAAQDQGLRDIRFVGRPEERDRTIQRVIQRSGARKSFVDGSW